MLWSLYDVRFGGVRGRRRYPWYWLTIAFYQILQPQEQWYQWNISYRTTFATHLWTQTLQTWSLIPAMPKLCPISYMLIRRVFNLEIPVKPEKSAIEECNQVYLQNKWVPERCGGQRNEVELAGRRRRRRSGRGLPKCGGTLPDLVNCGWHPYLLLLMLNLI